MCRHIIRNVLMAPTLKYHYEVMRLQNGRSIIMYMNHTFSYKGDDRSSYRYLYCSKRESLKCVARIKMTKDGVILNAITDHNHIPPFYHKRLDGTYIKLQ